MAVFFVFNPKKTEKARMCQFLYTSVLFLIIQRAFDENAFLDFLGKPTEINFRISLGKLFPNRHQTQIKIDCISSYQKLYQRKTRFPLSTALVSS